MRDKTDQGRERNISQNSNYFIESFSLDISYQLLFLIDAVIISSKHFILHSTVSYLGIYYRAFLFSYLVVSYFTCTHLSLLFVTRQYFLFEKLNLNWTRPCKIFLPRFIGKIVLDFTKYQTIETKLFFSDVKRVNIDSTA